MLENETVWSDKKSNEKPHNKAKDYMNLIHWRGKKRKEEKKKNIAY